MYTYGKSYAIVACVSRAMIGTKINYADQISIKCR